ncbi:hypothetical protein Tco_0381965 [Tanacetum coccineum]
MSTETNEEHQNVTREEGQRGNSVSISATTGISDLEEKTFTTRGELGSGTARNRPEQEPKIKLYMNREPDREASLGSGSGISGGYEIERLTRLGDGDKANISNDSHVLRLKASKSGPLNKHAEERENFHAVISTPRAFEEDVPSPVVLAKPRSRGRTAMYRMARSPYYRGPSTLSKKKANLHPTPSLISSQPTWELEGSNGSKMPGKSRSSVLDDLGSGGPMRRSRQKTPSFISSQPAWELEGSNGSKMIELDCGRCVEFDRMLILCSHGRVSYSKHKSEFDSSAIVENRETRMRNSGYGFVPIEST